MNNKLIGVGAAVILLMAGAAAVASYTTRESLQPKAETNNLPVQPQPKKQPQRIAAAQPMQQPAQPRCDDKNIVGTVAGGAVGGIAGSQIGNGAGKTAATIGGVLGGALLGNQYIPTRNVTCRN